MCKNACMSSCIVVVKFVQSKKTEIAWQVFTKINTKFHENLSSSSCKIEHVIMRHPTYYQYERAESHSCKNCMTLSLEFYSCRTYLTQKFPFNTMSVYFVVSELYALCKALITFFTWKWTLFCFMTFHFMLLEGCSELECSATFITEETISTPVKPNIL